MKTLAAILLLCLLFCIGNAETANCSQQYAIMEPKHTRCLLDNPTAEAIYVTEAEKDLIIAKHNEVRANVSGAANMLTLYWNETLAETAEKWAKQCEFKHDSNRREPAFSEPVGQNLAFAWGSNTNYNFTDVIRDWASEKRVWTYGEWTVQAGHYIQEINSLTQYIGCGAAMCQGKRGNDTVDEKYLVCNYYPSTYANVPPFIEGEPCAECPNHCRNNSQGKPMCDCQSPICINGGSTNTKSCKCKCTMLWAGVDCSQPICPPPDKYYDWCATMSTDYCNNEPYKKACPRRCGHPHCPGSPQ